MECQILVLPQQKQLLVSHGTNLMKALRDAGLGIDAPCGGKGTCGKCAVTVNGKTVPSCSYRVMSDITVVLPEFGQDTILTAGMMGQVAADPVQPGYLAAIDIGTTTVVCMLMDDTGKKLAVKSMANPQGPWGADVISRIQHAQKGQREVLTDVVRQGLQTLLEDSCVEAGIAMEQIGVISVVGNSCMQQLFLGMEVDNLASVPFAPVITRAEAVDAAAYFPACGNAKLLIVPDIAGFVGADTMGCILAEKLYEAKDTVLMVDIGTNGELVLAHQGRLAACSTAAGPALEGGNISCGMRAAPGAIDHIWRGGFSTVGGVKAKGICGSGLVDAAAVMLEEGVMNFRGRVLTPEHTYTVTPGVTLTQDDIRQLQMAKGAIAAGIQLLTEHMGLGLEAIDRVILAGAFGSFLNADNACRIGLLPEELAGKIVAAGNIALSGARALAMDKNLLPLTDVLAGQIEAVELAQLPQFNMTFAENMLFAED